MLFPTRSIVSRTSAVFRAGVATRVAHACYQVGSFKSVPIRILGKSATNNPTTVLFSIENSAIVFIFTQIGFKPFFFFQLRRNKKGISTSFQCTCFHKLSTHMICMMLFEIILFVPSRAPTFFKEGNTIQSLRQYKEFHLKSTVKCYP